MPNHRRRPFYRVDFAISDQDDVQVMLNRLYGYERDITTKVNHRNRLNLIVLLLEELARRGELTRFDSALDVGCSAGACSRILSDFGFRFVLGIDTCSAAVAVAERTFAFKDERFQLEYRTADAETTDFGHLFDFVLCTEVIEHAKRPERVIQNIKNVL